MNILRTSGARRGGRSAYTLVVSTIGLLCASTQVEAQEPPANAKAQAWWEEQKANPQITACRVSWDRTQRVNPNLQADPEKWAARELEAARQEKVGEAEAQRRAEVERREAEVSRKGRTVASRLDFVRVGKSVLCKIAYPEIRYHAIEFSDGVTSLFSSTQFKDKPISTDGVVTRNPDSVLWHSASGTQVARFLLGIPLKDEFSIINPSYSPTNSFFSENKDGNVVLESKFDPNPRLKDAPATLTLSKEHNLPIVHESFAVDLMLKANQLSRLKGKSLTRISIGGYQQYKNGIWFPSKITVTDPISTDEYTLVKAAFNEDVDPMELRLPADLRVADTRFPGSKPAIYKLENGKIPSDDEVRKMLNLDKEATKAKDTASKEAADPNAEQPSSPIAPAAGLMFMAMGSVMWVHSRKGETDSADQK